MKNNILSLSIRILLFIFIAVNLCGCRSARELNELMITDGLGVDKTQMEDSILLTAQMVRASELGKISSDNISGGVSEPFWNLSSTGESVFEAIRNMTKKTGHKIYVSHSQVLIFGDKIAKEGLEEYFDFFIRAHEMRPTTFILISRDTAAKVLEVVPRTGNLTGVHLADLVKGYDSTSHYEKITLAEFTNALMSNTTAPIAPLVGISYNNGNKDLYISGMAVFKKAKMIGTLSDMESMGLLWADGKIKGGYMDVPLTYGKGKAVFEILSAKTKSAPQIKDGKISMNIEINANSSLVEQPAAEDLAKVNAAQVLEEKQEMIIRSEIINAFEKSKGLKADIFGFGEKIHKKYPNEWKKIKNSWDEIYPSIELNLSVDVKIRKTESITKSAAPEKEEIQ